MARLAADQVNAWIVKNIIRNLHIECSNSTQVVIKQGSAVGADDGSIVMEAGADTTVDITNSVGSINALDQGSEQASTWYYVWMIWNPSTETVAGLLSASSTNPVLPSGYTKKRLVGAVRNNNSSNFLPFVQRGAYVTTAVTNLFSQSGVTSEVALSLAAVVPSIAKEVYLLGVLYNQTGTADVYLNVGPKSQAVGIRQKFVMRDQNSEYTGSGGVGRIGTVRCPLSGQNIYVWPTGSGTYNVQVTVQAQGYTLAL